MILTFFTKRIPMSDGTDGDDIDDGGDSDLTSTDTNEKDEEHVPTAPWFTAE